MATRPPVSALANDRGVAAVVGFVLIFAIALSYYGYVAKAEVPRWGLENEEKWDDQMESAMLKLARDSASAVGSQVSVAGSVPRPPAPESLDVPLMGKTQPIDPDGLLQFSPDDPTKTDEPCPSMVSKRSLGSTSQDTQVGGGCLRFDARPVYGQPFAYQIEHGALIRVEGERAHMVSPPPLKLRTLQGEGGDIYEVLLTSVSLGGPSRSTSVGSGSVAIDLIAGASDSEAAQGANAHTVQWTLTTKYPTAWKSWLNQRLSGAGFAKAENAACVSGDTGGPCTGLTVPAGQVVVVLRGPASGTTPDISYTLTQGTYSVSIR